MNYGALLIIWELCCICLIPQSASGEFVGSQIIARKKGNFYSPDFDDKAVCVGTLKVEASSKSEKVDSVGFAT